MRTRRRTVAEQSRARLVELGLPFIAETVIAETACAHRSKLELIGRARAAGYYVALHVLVVPEDLAVSRVAHRVAAGGHDVPVDKIRSGWRRLWPIVGDAVALADVATVWDNSKEDGPDQVALFSDGLPVGAPAWPWWAPGELSERWPRT